MAIRTLTAPCFKSRMGNRRFRHSAATNLCGTATSSLPATQMARRPTPTRIDPLVYSYFKTLAVNFQ